MLCISVELVHGVIRAANVDDVALTGDRSTPEWPPSPARLYAALVAGGGTGERVPEWVGVHGLSSMEGQVPKIYASPPSEVLESEVLGRFVVIDESAENTVQNYPVRSSQRIQPGTRVAPKVGRLVYCWPEVDLPEDDLMALRYRAARVPYFGCSDSPAVVRVSTDVAEPDLPVWEPAEDGTCVLPVPPRGYVDVLDAAFRRWSAGEPLRRSWIRTPLQRYRVPGAVGHAAAGEAAATLWLRFDRPLQQRHTVAVARLLRAAVLERVEAAVGRAGLPEVLHGHLARRGPGQHSARWVPLPTVDVPHADGRLRGAMVWLPAGIPPGVEQLVRDALADVEVLVLPGQFHTRVVPFDGTTRPWSSHPRRWIGPATVWRSVTPVLFERYTGHEPTIDDVQLWCSYAGLPEPVDFRVSRAPMVTGSRMGGAPLSVGGRVGPYGYFELTFAGPVRGPVVLGRGRGVGIGLCAPVTGGDRE